MVKTDMLQMADFGNEPLSELAGVLPENSALQVHLHFFDSQIQ